MTSSRLDRLFVLLETGSSSITRSAAAKQLGEVQKLHPHELNTLLTRTATYLRSNCWETRIAASEAVRAIVSNVPQWVPPPGDNSPENNSCTSSTIGRLQFGNFDMSKVLSNSTHLMASEGKEYDLTDDESSGGDLKEKLAKQRQVLNARLGLDVAGKVGIDTDSLFSNEDLILASAPLTANSIKLESDITTDRKPLRDLIGCSESGVATSGLSSREMNRAKRKARQVNKQKSRDPDETNGNSCDVNDPDKKRAKIEATTAPPTSSCNASTGNVTIKEELDTSNALLEIPEVDDNGDWPLEWFCDRLSQDLFSSSWEHRHGAATALREIITVHGKGAGRNANLTAAEQEENHQIWLEDLSIRLLCVLALDRFGDFVSDAVVAPVRETCAQSLCVTLTLMAADRCQSAMKVLLQLVTHSEWETRHGGFLGLKYLLAVVKDGALVDGLLPEAFPHILTGLQDPVDDVGAVAASSLIPVTGKLVQLVPESLPTVVAKLWDLLTDQDELTAACNSFMGLLAALLSLKQVQVSLPRQQQQLRDVVPKLWPFLFHNTSSVRMATLQTLGTLIALQNDIQQWDCRLLQDSLRFLFQLVLIEAKADVRNEAERIWILLVETSNLTDLLNASCPLITIWLFLSMQPTKLPLDLNLFIRAATNRKKNNLDSVNSSGIHDYDMQVAPSNKLYIGGGETVALANRERNSVEVRCALARMLGRLSCYVIRPAPDIVYTSAMEKPVECYEKVLLVHLNSKSALQRTMAGLVMAEWARHDRITVTCPLNLRQRLHDCLNELVYFDEIASSFTRLTSETRDYLATLKHYKIAYHDNGIDDAALVFTLEKIEELTGDRLAAILKTTKLKAKIIENLEERRRSIHTTVIQTKSEQQSLSVSCLAALSGATVMFKSLPAKLTPVAKPLMESLRREQNENLQKTTAGFLVALLEQCRGRQPCPNDKIVINLCTFLRCDPDFTPVIHRNNVSINYNGILTLNNQQRSAEKAMFKRTGPGRPPTTPTPNNATEPSFDECCHLEETDEHQQKLNRIQRRGATVALEEITKFFGPELPEKLPKLWYFITGQLVELVDPATFDPHTCLKSDDAAETLLWQLQVLEVTAGHIDASLVPTLKENSLNRLCVLLAHPYRAVRHLSARCLGTFAKLDSVVVMELIVAMVLPKLESVVGNDDLVRQGGIEAVACIIDSLQFDIVPYVVLLIVPLLGRMSDPNRYVRSMGTLSFARLVQLMPLDGAIHEPPAFQSSKLYVKRDEERQFLKQLLAPSTIPDFALPIQITTTLRSYQQAGVNWLNFLNKYKLHGILCDDMGLGKTLQSIAMLAADHYVRDVEVGGAVTSLVICPPTLTGHWVYEIDKFLAKSYLRPLLYNGTPLEREKLRLRFKNYNLIVASYDIVRKDIAIFATIKWNYVILDEGHVIKNGKTRTSQAIKSLTSNHRLILSGTPIQNNVLELWSLFDFLMPGFLGSEKEFMAKYSRPILASRDSKCSKRDQEMGLLAMENLHRQVLPFLLRRVKEDVLDDLPPKITQDYYCDLSPLQEKLYDDFSKTQMHQNLLDKSGTVKLGNSHIFQALRYLQNVCNHPKLVLNESHPHYKQILTKDCRLDDISHSAKLPALKQLLQDCGIGTESDSNQSNQVASSSSAGHVGGAGGDLIVNEHRALIFCQLKAMLDIIEQDLFKKHMPSVTYLRLDGAVPPNQRHRVVTRFNNDPSIDVLLLTTQVGGLGLNLTGADTVIFVEHDWNPMKDLQAMDRAHRIGQRKVVNVYRLITRATLEEKIMGLQKFKVQTVNTIITGNNSKLETMGTDQLLDLFTHNKASGGGGGGGGETSSTSGGTSGGGFRNILETLPDLWDPRQYDDEYDLSQFISKLK